MTDLSVNIAGVKLKNPIIAASGTFGFGREYNELFSIEKLGGISLKGTTLNERTGNNMPRIAETPSGMLNSVGLQNPGIDHLINDDIPWLKEQNTVMIANIAGATVEDYVAACEKINGTAIDMVELNISCPNVKAGGAAFGTSCESVSLVTKSVRAVLKKPLMVKLSPNVTDITEMALAAESEGADAISLINTLLGMRIDITTKRPVLNNNVGGLSGAAIFPVALRMVWQVASKVKVPVVGMGGITKWQDAIEMMQAGASALQVGTAFFTDPFAGVKIIDGIKEYCQNNNIEKVSSITKTVIPW